MNILLVLVAFFIVAFNFVYFYNRIQKLSLKVDESLANVDVFLNQRYDTLKATLKISQEFKIHETQLLNELTTIREHLGQAADGSEEKFKLHQILDKKIPQIVATFEAYPEIKSSEHYLNLMDTIEIIEENISASRRSYNAYVNEYNTFISMFPGFLFANLYNKSPKPLFEAPKEKTLNPIID
ncbi:LemA family protein [Bacillus toyonensis]|uniref:LemA family protein n=1 Tax=Bacillus toyonensis TaxID=155322 RepID=UPI002E1A6221|nr:LemA family protein [Bacillus toyonensis]